MMAILLSRRPIGLNVLMEGDGGSDKKPAERVGRFGMSISPADLPMTANDVGRSKLVCPVKHNDISQAYNSG